MQSLKNMMDRLAHFYLEGRTLLLKTADDLLVYQEEVFRTSWSLFDAPYIFLAFRSISIIYSRMYN